MDRESVQNVTTPSLPVIARESLGARKCYCVFDRTLWFVAWVQAPAPFRGLTLPSLTLKDRLGLRIGRQR
jgi:hypothetical protein